MNAAIRKWINQARHLIISVVNADWSYEKAFYYITVGLVLIAWLLKAINIINMSLSWLELLGNGLLLCLTILAIAFFLAHGTRLLIRAIKKDLK